MKLRPTGPTFGLTLRGMLVITALLAIGMALVGIKVKRARDQQAIADEIVWSGGSLQRQSYGMAASMTDRTWFERLLDLDLEAQIVQVSLVGPLLKNADIERLAGLPELKHLHIGQSDLDGTSLAALERLPNLTTLDLRFVALTDEGITAISRLPAVAHLSINVLGNGLGNTLPPARLTDTSLVPLKNIKSLRHLFLNDAFTDAQLRALNGMAQVEDLQLSVTGLTDAGVATMLNGMVGLRSLTIYNASISGSGLAKLRDCPRLTTLQFNECALTDEALENISQLTQLIFLHIEQTFGPWGITDRGLRNIGNLSRINRLILRGVDLSDDGLQRLAGLSQLEQLEIYGPNAGFSTEGLAHLKSLTNLKSVKIHGQSISATLQDIQRAVPGIAVQP
jgi:Leucine Rich repeat